MKTDHSSAGQDRGPVGKEGVLEIENHYEVISGENLLCKFFIFCKPPNLACLI